MSDAKSDAKAIFLEALECKGADELRRFLDQACEADPALRPRVDELLRAHQDAGAFLRGAEHQEATRDRLIVEGQAVDHRHRHALQLDHGQPEDECFLTTAIRMGGQ